MNTLTFSVFADMHYAPKAFYSRAEEKLEYIQKKAKERGSAFIIHAGDLTHFPVKHKKFVDKYCDFEIPSYNCLGNHDSDHTSFKKTLKAYRMPNDYYYFDCQGFRMVVLNFNYFAKKKRFKPNEIEYVPYSKCNYSKTLEGSIGLMPPVEMEWLKTVLDESPYPCILISHQSVEREADGIINAKEVRDIIDEANRKHKHRVMLVINGHYHIDHVRMLNNVVYLDLNSCAFDYIAEKHHLYPKKMERKYFCLNHTLNVNEAIHAVITITDDGEIDIEGMQGTYFMGVDRKKVGVNPCDESNREATPNVSASHFVLE